MGFEEQNIVSFKFVTLLKKYKISLEGTSSSVVDLLDNYLRQCPSPPKKVVAAGRWYDLLCAVKEKD